MRFRTEVRGRSRRNGGEYYSRIGEREEKKV
jgi:hypothetical protein